MKSTLLLEFRNQLTVGTSVTISINRGGAGNTIASMYAKAQRTQKGEFEVFSIGPNRNNIFSFVGAWNGDFRDIGGFGNIEAVYFTENLIDYAKITIDDENWTFNSVNVFNNTPDEIIATFENTTPPEAKSFTHTLTGADCLNADYSISIQGGVSPYTIYNTSNGDLTNVPANSTFQIRRGNPSTIRVEDSQGTLIQSKVITPPKKFRGSDFTIEVVPENGWNTANVSPNVVLQNEVLPITYSLDGVTYSSTGSFSDLDFEQNYTMYIKDAFDCVVQKSFVTLEDFGTDLPQDQFRESFISNAGTLIFSLRQELSEKVRKNPNNTLSCSEVVQLPYAYVHKIVDPETPIVQQFKSSYNYNKVTLFTNGTDKEIFPVLQSDNLNQIEKVDAILFRSLTGKMGLYFDGGDTYVPNTSTSNGTSYYGTNTLGEQDFPSWGMVGQKIVIDGVGIKTVKRITTDPQRGLYLEFADNYTDTVDTDVKVQVNFNRQKYNTYEFTVPYNLVEGSGRIVIEKGFNGLVELTYVSELIKQVPDDPNLRLIEWSDPYNKSGIVHQTGITHFAWLYARLNHKTVSEAELFNSDTDVFNIDQTAYTVADFETAVLGYKMENKLALAAGMENFYINKLPYKKESMESEIQGDSNIHVIKALFRLGGNDLTRNDEEIVLDPPSTPLSAKPGGGQLASSYMAFDEDGLILNGDGGFLVVDV